MTKKRAAAFIAWVEMLLDFCEHPERWGRKKGDRVRINRRVEL